jgi:hypothetical protein
MDQSTDRLEKFLVAIPIAVIFIAIIVGLFLSGTPEDARKRGYDTLRISALQTISNVIDSYWYDHRKLPANLDELFTNAERAGTTPLTSDVALDPETKVPYTYHPVSNNSYELCATFLSDGKEIQNGRTAAVYIPPPVPGTQREPTSFRFRTWSHPAGSHCFLIEQNALPPR